MQHFIFKQGNECLGRFQCNHQQFNKKVNDKVMKNVFRTDNLSLQARKKLAERGVNLTQGTERRITFLFLTNMLNCSKPIEKLKYLNQMNSYYYYQDVSLIT